MDERVTGRPTTFNGPLEAGVRAVAILAAAHPHAFDLQRMVAFDYLLVHTGDIGGPDSLHPPAPLHSAEILVRRKLVEKALMLMMTRDLIRRQASPDGIRYQAGENAAPFVASLQSAYLTAMKARAAWLADVLGDKSDAEFRSIMRNLFDEWVEEFQSPDSSARANP